jgi:hypothetical protein
MIPHKLTVQERAENVRFCNKLAYIMFGLILLIVILGFTFAKDWSVSTKIFASVVSSIPVLIGVAIIKTRTDEPIILEAPATEPTPD